MSDSRAFENKFPEYDDSIQFVDPNTNRLIEEFETPVLAKMFDLLQILEKRLSTEVDMTDFSVYTGTSGIALLYLHLAEIKACEGKQDFLKNAMSYIEPVLPTLKKKRFSFMCGVPGPLAVGSVAFNKSEMEKESKDLAQRLENLERDICIMTPDMPDELLYGRAGFLYSLLYVRKYNGAEELQGEIIKQIVAMILRTGKHWAKKFKNTSNFPLYYEWHDKAYVGSAHGFAGILYMLLQAREFMTPEDLTTLVKPSIEIILSLQFSSGNFPSSLGNTTDRLIHWCHGAPGVIHLLLLSYEVFSEDKYLQAARQCAEIIWKKGLLKKGYGLCHGTAGNGYALLRMYQVTKEQTYLYQALKFGEWCCDYGKHGCRDADRPLSLFEGLAGTIYFLSDLLEPMNAAFPAFQL